MTIELLAFDADDTLWHNEILYRRTQQKWKHLLSGYMDIARVDEYLFETEKHNLPYFGFGIKSFTLSMIQAAAELTQGCIKADDLKQIVDFARQMLDEPIELLDGVRQTIDLLSQAYPLMIITKGDLLDQQLKLSKSGLESNFKWVEVVTDKTPEIYARLLDAYHIDPGKFLMVGNSLRSDILPVVALGAQAVYIPYELTWAHEHEISHFDILEGYYSLDHISHLPGLLAQFDR